MSLSSRGHPPGVQRELSGTFEVLLRTFYAFTLEHLKPQSRTRLERSKIYARTTLVLTRMKKCCSVRL